MPKEAKPHSRANSGHAALHPQAIALLLQGKSQREVGETIGVGRSTIFAWMAEGHSVRVAYDSAVQSIGGQVNDAVAEVGDVLREAVTVGAGQLLSILEDDDASPETKIKAFAAVARYALPTMTEHSGKDGGPLKFEHSEAELKERARKHLGIE